MEHRLQRKHRQSNTDTCTSNEINLKKRKHWKNDKKIEKHENESGRSPPNGSFPNSLSTEDSQNQIFHKGKSLFYNRNFSTRFFRFGRPKKKENILNMKTRTEGKGKTRNGQKKNKKNKTTRNKRKTKEKLDNKKNKEEKQKTKWKKGKMKKSENYGMRWWLDWNIWSERCWTQRPCSSRIIKHLARQSHQIFWTVIALVNPQVTGTSTHPDHFRFRREDRHPVRERDSPRLSLFLRKVFSCLSRDPLPHQRTALSG